MDKETLNIIIGAGITLVVSLATTIVNALLQKTKDDNEKRRQIVIDRIKELEIFSKETVLLLGKIAHRFEAEYKILNLEKKKEYFYKTLEEMTAINTQWPHFASISINLNDEINNLFFQLSNDFDGMLEYIGSLHDLATSKDKPQIATEVKFEIARFADTYTRLIKEFDNAKIHPPKI